jgi:hypothetical protein
MSFIKEHQNIIVIFLIKINDFAIINFSCRQRDPPQDFRTFLLYEKLRHQLDKKHAVFYKNGVNIFFFTNLLFLFCMPN